MDRDRKEDIVIEALVLLTDYCNTEGINIQSALEQARVMWECEETLDVQEREEVLAPTSSSKPIELQIQDGVILAEGDFYTLLGTSCREEMHVMLEKFLSEKQLLVRTLGTEIEYVVALKELRPFDE